jgi:hypothetical protein
MIGELIGEVLGRFFVEIIFNKIISPFFKITGSLTRWLLCFGKTSFKDILKKDYNTRVGLIVTLLITFLFMFLLY